MQICETAAAVARLTQSSNSFYALRSTLVVISSCFRVWTTQVLRHIIDRDDHVTEDEVWFLSNVRRYSVTSNIGP